MPTSLKRAASPKATATSQQSSSWNSTPPQSNSPSGADPKRSRGKKTSYIQISLSLSFIYIYLLLFVIFEYMYFCVSYFLTKHDVIKHSFHILLQIIPNYNFNVSITFPSFAVA